MNTLSRRAAAVTGLVLALGAPFSWGGPPPNPTASDAHGNTAGGTDTLLNNASADNTAFGYGALRYNTTGFSNTASGFYALRDNTTGAYNTAFGDLALSSNTTGGYNTASGFQALYSNTTGHNNTASGVNALIRNTTGASNTASGVNALYANTDGSGNTASGSSALYTNNGNYNTANGRNALGANTTGANNIALGYNAGALLTTGSHNIHIGHPGNAGETATQRLGQNQTRTFVAGVRNATGLTNLLPVYINDLGQLGVVTSSERFKADIRNMADASQGLYALRPVVYRYKAAAPQEGPSREYGLIAEEVAKVYPDLVIHGANGRIDAVQYHKLTPMLLNEVQRLNQKTQAQAREIGALKQQVALVQTQNQRLAALEARLLEMERRTATKRVALNP